MHSRSAAMVSAVSAGLGDHYQQRVLPHYGVPVAQLAGQVDLHRHAAERLYHVLAHHAGVGRPLPQAVMTMRLKRAKSSAVKSRPSSSTRPERMRGYRIVLFTARGCSIISFIMKCS